MRVKNYHRRLQNDREQAHLNNKIKNIEWFEECDKGCLVYIEGEKYPMRGLMYWDDFIASLIWKKGLGFFLHFISGKQDVSDKYVFKKKNIFELLIILAGVVKLYPFIIKFVHEALWDNIYENKDKYCQPIREFYRVWPEEYSKERDIFCFFSEADPAYKYREQDIIPNLDKEAFEKNPGKETKRLMDLMVSRERKEDVLMRSKWAGVLKLIPIAFIYLRIFKPKILRAIKKAVKELNLDEISPSPEDMYWMNCADSYRFHNLSYEARKMLNS